MNNDLKFLPHVRLSMKDDVFRIEISREGKEPADVAEAVRVGGDSEEIKQYKVDQTIVRAIRVWSGWLETWLTNKP